MRLRILSVGRDRRDPLTAVTAEYVRRLDRYYSAEIVEVREVPLTRSADPGYVLQEEGRRLLDRLTPGERVVALDRTGRMVTSEELADQLRGWIHGGSQSVAFLIGGPLGLDEAVLKRADLVLSLSTMTLPHKLARVVLAEQLYRAATILRGEPYHK